MLRVAARSLRAGVTSARCGGASPVVRRTMCTASSEREKMEFDVVVVGGGPAGLSAAIRLKQLSPDLAVCLLEKGAEIGSHVLSGNVFEPIALNELLPDWKDRDAPLVTKANDDRFYFLTEKSQIRLPNPPTMNNHGNYIISLSDVCKWLGAQAEALGVEIYAGNAAAEVIYDDKNKVCGVATGDLGIGKDGKKKSSYQAGMELLGRQTIFAEGCRGSLTKTLFKKYNLRSECEPQTFGLGVKELWEVPASQHKEGLVEHTLGWPMDMNTWGGSFMYHMDKNRISLGYVVGLDYENPYLSPYQEFQRWKHHPHVAQHLKGGQCVMYGARALNEGGFQSIPKLTFPGGVLVGDTAGFLNVPKIKGSHTAMKSGMLAAEAINDALAKDVVEAVDYESRIKESWVYEELRKVRNIRPAYRYGLLPFLAYSAIDTYVLRGNAPWTFSHHAPDNECTKPAEDVEPIEYPKPDGKLSFDLLTNLARSGTNHNADQVPHLRLIDNKIPTQVNLATYAGLEGRYCPARVYEFVEKSDGKKELVINAQNCLHCKTCDIKDPTQNINWTVPEGGGGPNYSAT